ncbi:MFS transporter, MCP family, solute carrier family 16, member 10 [Exophiala viscosa]|uniref:MFS transporter, MCP family, solute carrier family 16, member 10 n=1 Tax=Exophiala viscosa TaxID=2486360 RepID=A0AAN6II36_9EURO|nr:MFS transporter, MCP family, solute carrier family 16, member 10 [Exophiala viscosa]
MEDSRISDFARFQSVRSNETRIPRKPVPRRLNSRQSSTRRPSSARSFAQAFSWLSAVLPERQPPLQEQEISEENISPILPKAYRKSWRYTSRFDPRMDSGLTLFDPDLQAIPKRQMSDASSVVRDLNVEWHLPPLRFSYTDTSNQSIINAAIDAPANLPPEKSGDTPPPNGGTLAWLQVLGAFFLYFNSWGTLNTFGVFQTYYVDNDVLHTSPSDISWIGSAQAFLAMMVGVVTGPLYDAGYFRHLILAGGIMVSLGFMMTSLCTTYWQTVLAQGLCIGICNGCLFVPSVAILPQYFTTKNALVNGIAASGSSLGGIIMPFVFVRLQAHIGFGWATRVLGFLTVATISISISVMKPRLMPASKRKLVDLSAFKEPEYCFFVCAVFFGFIGFLVPLFYLGLYASSTGATSASFAFYLLPILNASSTFGRIAPNFLAGFTGPLNVYIPVALVAAVLIFAWCGITNFAGMIVFAVLYGFFSGGFVGLMTVSLVTLTPDLRTLGTRTGQAFFIASFGVLMGSPVAGAILNQTGSWVAVKCFAGTAVLMAMVFLVAARTTKVGWSLRVKT